METLLHDLRYAARTLARQPGFAAIAILTLAIGIGANTAIYSVVNATLLRPLPYHEPDRLMRVSLIVPARRGRPPEHDMVWSYPKYQTFRNIQTTFDSAALYNSSNFSLSGPGEAEQIRGEYVEASYFPLLGIPAEAGRTFRAEEDSVPERDQVAMISHNLWINRFGGDPAAIGKTVTLNLKPYTIVGVVPAGFRPLSGLADVWIPLHAASAGQLAGAFNHSYEMVARLKPGVTPAQAVSATTVLGRRIDEAFSDSILKGWGAEARTLDNARTDPAMRTAVLILFGAVSFVLLIACVNIANLLLARGTVRRREIAIRLAVGAGRARIVRQLLTESVLLSLGGAALGLGFAWAGVRALSVINPANGTAFGTRMSGLTVIGLTCIRLDISALLFTVAVALITGVLFGIAPALQGARAGASEALKSGGAKSTSFGAGRNILVISEIALAVVLLVGSGLMIKSFGRLMATRTGVDPDHVLTARVNLPRATDAAVAAFYPDLEARLAKLPGVLFAGMANCFALAGGCNGTIMWFRDREEVAKGSEPLVGVHWATSSYFTTMHIPLLRGRLFTPADRKDAPKVVLINETAARKFWPGESPLGHIVGVGQGGFGDHAEVVGVVGDVRYGQMDELPQPDVYLPFQQSPRGGMMIYLRTAGDPAIAVAGLREQVHALNRDLPVFDIRTMEERMRESTGKARFSATLLTVFAGIALLLSAVGIYGVMAYVVTQRTREIGIRMALGARPGDVLGLMLRRGAILAIAGVAIGTAGALGATRVLTTLLYEVRPNDAATYVAMAVLLLVVTIVASYVPARRAAAVDPSSALRSE
ncbi:MAG TPA: ABC transporter permease [Candidatus Acidoferrum sp.]|nr:ABC transporter permease [Candidatus Acidoferrum sp.]